MAQFDSECLPSTYAWLCLLVEEIGVSKSSYADFYNVHSGPGDYKTQRLSLRAMTALKIPEHLGDSQQILVDDEMGRR
ncbi:hypothetical protein E5288_WYG003791 [Bos mutus]|uniref:Uncharacterized protein n=1 Tax=Bos mutus TaxID=72004 RepID=A0A6B0RMK0_9CETA|nr:hypothetical protein [Bos mutus]